jgi:HAE1 family hydrophobic/amphiphilic exporter-1
MTQLTRVSLRHRGLVALIAILVAVFGLVTVPRLKQQLFPSLTFPAAVVFASQPGASPEVIEQQVTIPIEQSVRGVAGLESIMSTSREGSVLVLIRFDFGTDIDDAVDAVQDAVNRVQTQLPDGVQPQVIAGSTDILPAVVLAASSDEDEEVFAEKLRRDVLPKIASIDGVREATLSGDRAREIVIEPNLLAVARTGVDVTALATVLRANGVVVPAGTLTEGDTSLVVQVGSPISTVDDIRDLRLPVAGGGTVRLGDVATVESRLTAATSITRTNGRPSLGIAVTPAPDGNSVAISHQIKELLPELTAALGNNAQLTPVFDQAPFVEQAVHGLTTEGALGLVMAVLVILVFLLSVRSTLVTAVSIPLSVLIALVGLWLGDHSLNILTLGALTIAVGRVVDDSIVVLENIKRHLSYGEERSAAVLAAVREVAGAVTASTVTTVAVFAPIALVGGLVGELFAPFALTITVALAASLLVSLTIVPVLAYWFLKPAGDGRDAEAIRRAAEARELRSPLQRVYLPIVEWATTRRTITVVSAVVVFVVTGCLAGLLKTNFFDQSGQTTLTITQRLPVGTSMAATDKAARKVEEVLARTEGIAAYQVTIGAPSGLSFNGGGSNVASFSVSLEDAEDGVALQEQLRAELSALSDVGQITVEAGEGGFSASRIEVIVRASDAETLAAATEQVRAAVAGTPDIVDVTTDLTSSSPRVQVDIDRAAAAELGLSEASIGQTVATAFRGAPLGQVTVDGAVQTVVLRLGLTPSSVDAVAALPLAPGVTLGDVATISTVDGPVQVVRVDGERAVTVSGTATGSNIGAITADLQSRLAALELPAGASYTVAGVSADQAEAFADLGLAMAAAVAIVFLVMAATFRSLIQPLILLVSIPFAATGAIIGLLITNTALGVPALIGMLMLVGIVVTNAIVLMDLINQYRDAGLGVRDAVIEGARHRLRPILMTAVATICALLPMAFGLTGSGGFISRPLAIVVIGGLLSSTVLTLILVPTLYTMVELRRERRRAAAAPVSPAPAGEPAAATAGS